MPQDSSGILEHSNKHSYLGRFILYRWSCVPFLCVEELPQFTEASEAPIALFRDEAVVRVCSQTDLVKGTYCEDFRRTADGINSRIIGIRDY